MLQFVVNLETIGIVHYERLGKSCPVECALAVLFVWIHHWNFLDDRKFGEMKVRLNPSGQSSSLLFTGKYGPDLV